MSEVSFPQSVADADAGPLGPVVCYKISLNTTRFARRGASYNISDKRDRGRHRGWAWIEVSGRTRRYSILSNNVQIDENHR